MGKQVKELYILAKSNIVKHIKGERHLSDLTESINFMIKKFNDYEKDRVEKKKIADKGFMGTSIFP